MTALVRTRAFVATHGAVKVRIEAVIVAEMARGLAQESRRHQVQFHHAWVSLSVRQHVDRSRDHEDRMVKATTDWTSIVIFAHMRTGRVSVGLKAVEFVNER
jgi:hypothetical protein